MNVNPRNIAVLGGGGKTGTILLNMLIARGYRPRVLLRKPVPELSASDVEIVYGDALDPECLRELLRGADALISTIGQRPGEPLVAGRLTEGLNELLAEAGIRRYIVLAGINVDAPGDSKGLSAQAATTWMRETFPAIHNDRQGACDKLFKSDLDWTLVRAPMIDFSNHRGKLAIDLADSPGKSVYVRDLADFLAVQLESDVYIRKCPFVAST